MIDQIAETIDDRRKLGFRFLLFVAVFLLFVLDKCLGLSFARLFVVIAQEFRSLFAGGKFNRASINAILIVALFALSAFYFFIEPVRKLIEVYEVVREPLGSPGTPFVFLASFFLIALVGYGSVLAVRRD